MNNCLKLVIMTTIAGFTFGVCPESSSGAILCYNNSVLVTDQTQSLVAWTTNPGACICTLSARKNSTKVRITLDINPTNLLSCNYGPQFDFRPTRGFGTSLSECRPGQSTQFRVSPDNSLRITYSNPGQNVFNGCLKFSVTEGLGEVTLQCMGDILPSPPTLGLTTVLAQSRSHSTRVDTSATEPDLPPSASPSSVTTSTILTNSTNATRLLTSPTKGASTTVTSIIKVTRDATNATTISHSVSNNRTSTQSISHTSKPPSSPIAVPTTASYSRTEAINISTKAISSTTGFFKISNNSEITTSSGTKLPLTTDLPIRTDSITTGSNKESSYTTDITASSNRPNETTSPNILRSGRTISAITTTSYKTTSPIMRVSNRTMSSFTTTTDRITSLKTKQTNLPITYISDRTAKHTVASTRRISPITTQSNSNATMSPMTSTLTISVRPTAVKWNISTSSPVATSTPVRVDQTEAAAKRTTSPIPVTSNRTSQTTALPNKTTSPNTNTITSPMAVTLHGTVSRIGVTSNRTTSTFTILESNRTPLTTPKVDPTLISNTTPPITSTSNVTKSPFGTSEVSTSGSLIVNVSSTSRSSLDAARSGEVETSARSNSMEPIATEAATREPRTDQIANTTLGKETTMISDSTVFRKSTNIVSSAERPKFASGVNRSNNLGLTLGLIWLGLFLAIAIVLGVAYCKYRSDRRVKHSLRQSEEALIEQPQKKSPCSTMSHDSHATETCYEAVM